jgi:hypothetical protein
MFMARRRALKRPAMPCSTSRGVFRIIDIRLPFKGPITILEIIYCLLSNVVSCESHEKPVPAHPARALRPASRRQENPVAG